MNFANGFVYGAGFTLAAVLVVAICKAAFHLGLC